MTGDRSFDPKVDVIFRALFGQERNLPLMKAMLNGMLSLVGLPPAVELTLLSPTQPIEAWDEKVGTVDVAVRDETGRESVVEMQCRHHEAFRDRILYYGARRYSAQLRAGNEYRELRPVVLL